MSVKFYESNGVKLFAECMSYRTNLVNIEIEKGVKTVNLYCPHTSGSVAVRLKSVMKQFPDVEELVISSNIDTIEISNFMFPNVRKVVSDSLRFVSGEMLCKKQHGTEGLYLLNAFCRHERDSIDLNGISIIAPYALEGTYARKFINSGQITFSRFSHEMFHGHISQINPSVCMNDGLFVLGNNLCMVEESSDRIVIPENISFILDGLDFSNIDEVIVRSAKQFESFCGVINSKTLFLDFNDRINVDTSACQNFKVSKNNPFYVSENGILYSHNNKMLLCAPRNKSNLIITDGTTAILNNAFQYCEVTSADIPDSVLEIDDMAFCNCRYLESITIGNGVIDIGEGAFSNCSLKDIDIPENVRIIRKHAFRSSNVQHITLHDGLQEIMEGAFANTQIQEIHIPKTVRRLGTQSLSLLINDIYVDEEYPTNLICALIYEDVPENRGAYCIHIKNYGNVYVPKCMHKESIGFLNAEFNQRQLDKDFTNSIYAYGSETAVKQDTAIRVYEDTKDETVGKYLRRAGRSIAKRLIKEQNDDMLIQFVNTGLLTGKTLKTIMDMANNANMSIAAAYILKELEGSDSNTSFRL